MLYERNTQGKKKNEKKKNILTECKECEKFTLTSDGKPKREREKKKIKT